MTDTLKEFAILALCVTGAIGWGGAIVMVTWYHFDNTKARKAQERMWK